MKTYSSTPNKQTGSMLLEGLISILLFSIGILAIVGLQSASIKMVGDAKYRSDASLLADQLVGQMWASRTYCQPGIACPPDTALQNAFCSSIFSAPVPAGFNACPVTGPMYTAWLGAVQASSLPGNTLPLNQPVVAFTNTPPAGFTLVSSSVATIIIYWSSPNEKPQAHKHVVVAELI